MTQTRETKAPTPQPDSDSKRESPPPPEPLFSSERTLTPNTASEPSIKNR